MSDTVANNKKWSKKKKTLVIVAGIVGFLLIAIVAGGLGALHWYCKVPEYNIVSSVGIADDTTRIIAHRGFRAKAPENTSPAFEAAGKAGYWGAECDTYRTKDGVWVIQHDPITYRMMDCTKIIEKSSYDSLVKHTVDSGNNVANYPDLKICTLDRYLTICDTYDMTAVIELKSKNTEHYDELLQIIDSHHCDAVIISFHREALEAMRKISDLRMFYLVQEITVDDIIFAKDLGFCGIDFNAAKEENFADDGAIIKKCMDSKLPLGAWTIDDTDTMKKCLDLGVKYITTNCITY